MGKKCTGSVKELIENVKGTPYGVLSRKSKNGKPQAISFNETIDSMKDVIEGDCANASSHGRFSDSGGQDGSDSQVCEQALAEEAPCFNIGKLNSTKVLKSRLNAKYKAKTDSYEDYEDSKYKSSEKSNIKKGIKMNSIDTITYNYNEGRINFIKINKKFFNSLAENMKNLIKKNFTWKPYERYWKPKNKNSETVLNQLGVYIDNSTPVEKKTIKDKKNFVLKQDHTPKSALQSSFKFQNKTNESALQKHFTNQVSQLDSNQKAIANQVLDMMPKLRKMEFDLEIVKNFVTGEIENRKYMASVEADHQDIF